MKVSNITFDESARLDVLELFDKTIDIEGFLVEKDNSVQRVLTKEGKEIHISEWAGVIKGSESFIKSDMFALIELAKKLE